MSVPAAIAEPSRIVLLRARALGDVVLATSVLEPLRRRFPRAHLTWLTDAAYIPLLQGLPELDAVLPLAWPGRRSSLEPGGFDLAVDLQGRLETGLLAQLLAERTLIFRKRTAVQSAQALFGKDLLLTRAHATQLYAETLRPLGIHAPGRLKVSVSAEAHARAEALLGHLPRPRVAINPGAGRASKRWPPERFAAVADALAAEGCAVVLSGGAPDGEVLTRFRAALTAPLAADLSGLPLQALTAGLARVDLLVCGDTGPAHLAAAMGTRVLALFGPTSPERWGPPAPGRALSLGLECSPCTNHGRDACPAGHHRCLTELGVPQVLAAARQLLAG